jgi:hypothetical protein
MQRIKGLKGEREKGWEIRRGSREKKGNHDFCFISAFRQVRPDVSPGLRGSLGGI